MNLVTIKQYFLIIKLSHWYLKNKYLILKNEFGVRAQIVNYFRPYSRRMGRSRRRSSSVCSIVFSWAIASLLFCSIFNSSFKIKQFFFVYRALPWRYVRGDNFLKTHLHLTETSRCMFKQLIPFLKGLVAGYNETNNLRRATGTCWFFKTIFLVIRKYNWITTIPGRDGSSNENFKPK